MSHRIIKGFLSNEEKKTLLRMGDLAQWLPGRQGTGYERASVQLYTLEAKCLEELGLPAGTGHDVYLLRYKEGSYIPSHKDDSLFGLEHHRINVLLHQSSEGGVLYFDGEHIELEELDAVVFRPDLILHEVTPITKGQRLLWTVGALV